MSPELLEELDLSFASSLRFGQRGGRQEAEKLIATLDDLISGNLTEPPTSLERNILSPIYLRLLQAYSRGSEDFVRAIQRYCCGWDFLRLITLESDASEVIPRGDWLELGAGDWKDLRFQAERANHLGEVLDFSVVKSAISTRLREPSGRHHIMRTLEELGVKKACDLPEKLYADFVLELCAGA